MAAITAKSSRTLNPSAPEFFPAACVNNIQAQTQFQNPSLHLFNFPFTSAPFLSSPSLTPNNPLSSSSSSTSIYYSPFIHYANTCSANSNYPKNQTNPFVSPQNHDRLLVPAVTEPSPPLVLTETKPQTQLVQGPEEEIGEVTDEVSPRGFRRSGGGGYRNRWSSGKGFGESTKKQWQAKVHVNDGGKNCSTGSSRRHAARSSFGASKHRHYPVVPIKSDGLNTTIMIRNIPNRYTRDLLMDFIDDHCMQENEMANEKLQNKERIMSAFDFLYLPMDFENKANKGYAFVNFTYPRAAWKFHLAVNNKRWGLFQSAKICETASARLQGKEELVRHFQSSSFQCETDDYLPVCFSPPRDGSKAKVEQRIIGRRIG